MRIKSITTERPAAAVEGPARERILGAAFAAFTEHGYAQASTLEIATRARVSKRELYALVGNKQEMLVACIAKRAKKIRMPADMPRLRDREALAKALATFGALLLREVSDPSVIAVFRLAIAEAERSPEVAQALNSVGREASRIALSDMLAKAQASGLLSGDAAEMAAQFMALLWGDLMVGLLLRVTDPPSSAEVQRRARDATDAFLRLHPERDAVVKASSHKRH